MGVGDGRVGDGSVRVPAELDWLRESGRGRDWLASLPARLTAVRERWRLRTGRRPFRGGRVSLVLPATLPDGTPAVLKLQYPDRESEHEAAALARWDGDGAVRLLAHDPDLHALVVERCAPGTPLYQAGPDRALDVLTALLPRLWVPAGAPFDPLAAEAARWAAALPSRWEAAGRPGGRRLVDAAVRALTELGPSQGEQVLLHQDLHAGNVLAARREPWLVIDPKPLVGEREFGVVAAVRGGELGDDAGRLRYRLDRLCSELALDRERVRGWAVGQTLAWAFQDGQALTDQLERASRLLDC
jgi:streptomycin 6-kinase